MTMKSVYAVSVVIGLVWAMLSLHAVGHPSARARGWKMKDNWLAILFSVVPGTASASNAQQALITDPSPFTAPESESN